MSPGTGARPRGLFEFGGASADETIQRLLDEHWKATALAAVRRDRDRDPNDWQAHVDQVDTDAQADAAIADGWNR
ncbi:hypothetical protein GCM10027174_45170 [Salinifilum aidingensis]